MKNETVEEFLARGGQVERLKEKPREDRRPYSRYKMKDLDMSKIISKERDFARFKNRFKKKK